MSGQVDLLSLRGRVSLFWVLGSGLGVGLEVPTEWAPWMEAARARGLLLATGGVAESEDSSLWVQMEQISALSEMSQHLVSVGVCFSGALNSEAEGGVGRWFQYSLAPIMEAVSLGLFPGISMPGADKEIDQVFLDPRVQVAVGCCEDVVRVLAECPSPDVDVLRNLARIAIPLSPSWKSGLPMRLWEVADE